MPLKEQKTQKSHLYPKTPLYATKMMCDLLSTKGTKDKSKNETTGEKLRFGKFSDGQQTTIEKTNHS